MNRDQQMMFTFPTPQDNLRPEEMTLSEFLNSNWRAILHPKAHGESKGQYLMLKADGKVYNGSYIGKFNDPQAAKRHFHYTEVYWAIWWNRVIPERVLAEYPQLLAFYQDIERIAQNVHVLDGPYIAKQVDEQRRYFHWFDVPMYSRIHMREFVVAHQLVSEQGGLEQEKQISMNAVERTCIALTRALSEIIHMSHRPHLYLLPYRGLGSKYKVRVRIPRAFSPDGFCTEYEVVEGTTVYDIRYTIEQFDYLSSTGKQRREFVQPSMLLSIDRGKGWEDSPIIRTLDKAYEDAGIE